MARQASSTPVKAALEQSRTQDQQAVVRSWLAQLEPELRRAVPRGVDAERIVRLALTEIRRTPQLALCTRESLLGGIMWSAQLGLEIGPPLGQSYLVPFHDHGVLVAQWILGYTGQLALMYRSPRIRDVYVGTVREGDGFVFKRGLEDVLVHEPKGFDESRRVVCYYLMVRYADGGHYIATMTPEEIERRRRRAQGGRPRSGAWAEWPEEMERKTLIRAHAKYLPLEVQVQRAFAADEQVLRPDADAEGGVVIPTTAEVAPEPPAEGRAPAMARTGDRKPSRPPESPPPAAPATEPPAEAGTQAPADPHDALRRQLGRLAISGQALRNFLAQWEVLEVSALPPEAAQEAADLLSGIDGVRGDEAAAQAVRQLEATGDADSA
jgi:recombination protein RecT